MSGIGKLFGAAFGLVSFVFKPLLKALLPGLPDQGPPGETPASFPNSNSFPKLGAPVPIMFGSPPGWFPEVLCRWAEYDNQREISYVLLRVCHGPAQLVELTAGNTPISAVAGLQLQEVMPGETATLADYRVWTNPDSGGIELLGGALDLIPFAATVQFVASTSTVRVTSGPAAFDGGRVGGRFTVSGSASNDGEYIIVTIVDSDEVTVTQVGGGGLTDETIACTLNIYRVTIGGTSKWVRILQDIREGDDESEPDDVLIAFDNGDGSTGTIVGPSVECWADFQVGDLCQAVRTASNDGKDFEIVALAGATAVVRPAPTTEAANLCSVVLVRRRIGPIAVCPPGTVVDRVGFNVEFQAGLYRTNDKGELRTATRGLEVQLQRIDDYGTPLDPPFSLGEFDFSGRDRTPQRFTRWRDVPVARYQLFIARSSPANEDSGDSDAMTLSAVMGRLANLDTDPNAAGDNTLLALRIVAGSALSNGLDGRITGRWQALHPVYEDGEWTAPRATADIAPAWAALRRLRGFDVYTPDYLLADAYWKARGWEYHAVLAGEITLRDATAQILAAGDALPWYDWRYNADRIWLDRLRNDPALLIHDGNHDESDLGQLPLGLVPEDDATGIEAQYTDARTADDRSLIVGSSTSLRQVRYDGVLSRQQAFELATRDLRRQRLRRVSASIRMLWDYVRVGRGSPALVQSDEHRWGQYAQLVSASGTTLIADRELSWHSTLQHRVWLPARDGAPGTPIDCTRGGDDRTLLLASAPPSLVSDVDGGERQVLVLEYPGHAPVPVLVEGVSASDGPAIAELSIVFDDPAIFDDPGDAPADEYPISGALPNLTIASVTLSASGQTITATWTMPSAAVGAQVEYRLSGATSWTALPIVVVGRAVWTVTRGGTYQVRVRALGNGPVGVATAPASVSVTNPTLSVTLSPASVPVVVGSSPGDYVSSTVTPVIVGGAAPVTGVWVRTSGATSITAVNSSGATQFTTNMAVASTKSATFKYTATDAASTTADSPTITIAFERYATSGPLP